MHSKLTSWSSKAPHPHLTSRREIPTVSGIYSDIVISIYSVKRLIFICSVFK